MIGTARWLIAASLAGTTCLAMVGPAAAGGSIKDGPDDGRKLSWSINVGGTSDYVFRGISQSAEDPAFQAGVDVSYGIFYIGAWGSTIDFGDPPSVNAEVDLYAGIKPVWGRLNFDFGVIYYAYPNASDHGAELDYVELKAGVSTELLPKLTAGVTGFYSPEYTGKQGDVWTVEGTAAYELPRIALFTPSISGTIGYQKGDAGEGFITANGSDDYLYWNAGLSLAVDKLTLDLRYWDTNIDNAGHFCDGPLFQCDARFVFGAKVTLP
jgi:uncharacterized protein (TIGR02001 family)